MNNMEVCCSNPNCFNAGKVFDDSVMIEDIRRRRICTACQQVSLTPTEADAHCSGCGDDCDTWFLQKYYKIHGRKDICCSENCLARTLVEDGEVDVMMRGRNVTRRF